VSAVTHASVAAAAAAKGLEGASQDERMARAWVARK